MASIPDLPQDRMRRLHQLASALSAATTVDDVARVLLASGIGAIGAEVAAFWEVTSDRVVLRAQAAHAENAQQHGWMSLNVEAPLSSAARTAEAVFIENRAEYAVRFPMTEALTRALPFLAEAYACLPLVLHGRAIAVVGFAFGQPRRFSADERELLSLIAQHAAIAYDRARLFVSYAEAARVAQAHSARKDEFLAMLGHELRNPLAAIVTALDIIRIRQPAPDREHAILERQVKQLTTLVGQLVEASRVTRGRIELHRTEVDLAGAVEVALDSVRGLLAERGHEMILSVPAGLVLDADRDRLAQVLANVLGNAAKYTPPRGRIELTAVLDAGFVRITVRDNGQGISDALMPELFDMFVQGERAADRREGGLGVGLPVVRSLVELHGGTVEAQSDGPGEGSTFTLRWPRAGHVPAGVQLDALAGSGWTQVLVVEGGEGGEGTSRAGEQGPESPGEPATDLLPPSAADD